MVDLSSESNASILPPSISRKIYIKILKQTQLEKIGIVASILVLKGVATFIINAIGKDDGVKWFSNRKKASALLREGIGRLYCSGKRMGRIRYNLCSVYE